MYIGILYFNDTYGAFWGRDLSIAKEADKT